MGAQTANEFESAPGANDPAALMSGLQIENLQILPYLALAGDRASATVSEVTNHCRTNIWVIEKFLDGRFDLRDHTITWMTPPWSLRAKASV